MTDLINFSIDPMYREKFMALVKLVNRSNSETFRLMVDFFFLRQDKIKDNSFESIDNPQKIKKSKSIDPNQKNLLDIPEKEQEKSFEPNSIEDDLFKESNGDDENE